MEPEENILEGSLERPPEGGLRLRVTEGAVRELRVGEGSRVFLAVKTSACRRLR